jgi:hypothetical protein
MAFEIMDKSIDDDSDSDNEMSSSEAAMAGLHIDEQAPAKPPRPMSIPMPPAPAPNKQMAAQDSEPEEDEDDPFSDNNGVYVNSICEIILTVSSCQDTMAGEVPANLERCMSYLERSSDGVGATDAFKLFYEFYHPQYPYCETKYFMFKFKVSGRI